MNLSAKIQKFPLRFISRQTGYIALQLAMEFMKPQIISNTLRDATRIIFRAFANSTKLI